MSGELVLVREFDGRPVRQRRSDGYFDATAMCKAAGKKWSHYWENQATKEYIGELSADAGIPASALVQVMKGGNQRDAQGTWVHPDIAIHLAQWCSPRFAVQVSKWVKELLTTGRVDLSPSAGQYATLDDVRSLMAAERESFRQALEAIRPALPGPSHPGPFWTVATRLTERYPDWMTTRSQRAKIRQIANNLVRTLHNQHVDYFNRDCAYHAQQIALLDKAIDIVKQDVERKNAKQGWGLLAGFANDPSA